MKNIFLFFFIFLFCSIANADYKAAIDGLDYFETGGGSGSVTINTTTPVTGAGTGSSFTLGVDETKLTLSNIGGAVTDAQVPNTITIDNATTAANLGADGVNALTEVDQAIKTALNDTSKLVVGTAGATDDCAKWDANGNLVTAGAACGTASGAPTDADYLVGTTNAGLSAEIVVGTSPGGELGGTWASPTLDDSVTVTGWVLGASTATTPAEDDNDTSVATSAYVQTEIAGLGAGGWTDGGTNVYPTLTSDQVAIGTTTPVAGAALTVLGTIAGSGSGPLSITNGNVGIGTFAVPTVLLHVGNTAGTPTSVGANDVYVQNDLEVDGTVYMGSCSGAGCGSSKWTDMGTTIYPTGGENVGIGTISPTRLLEIATSTSSVYPSFGVKNSAGESFRVEVNATDDIPAASIGSAQAINLDFQTNDATALSIGPGGNVGIGSTAPNALLDIRTASSIGWTVVDQTDNQACNTGCSAGCVFGFENATGVAVTNIVSCAATTADLCLCSGSN